MFDDFAKGMWTAVDFTIEQGEGKMLFCGPDSQAPPLRLNPRKSGWHHIFVATYRPSLDPAMRLGSFVTMGRSHGAPRLRSMWTSIGGGNPLIPCGHVPRPATRPGPTGCVSGTR